MSEYMDLVERLKNSTHTTSSCDECPGDCNGLCLFEEAAAAIIELGARVGDLKRIIDTKANVLTVQYQKWISVKDKLPEPRTEVLVYVQPNDKKQPHPAFISLDFLEHDGYWAESTQPWNYDVTHWMPLPKPPKEEGWK